MDKAKDQVEDAAKRAKDAAMKLFGGSKKFQGSGNKLGGGSGSAPVNHPAARRPHEPAASPPQKAAARAAASAQAANPERKLGFHDSPAPSPAPAPTPASLPVPAAAPAEPVIEVTDSLNEAAAIVISSGPEGLRAAKTICSVVNNVLKAPKEAKYRQLYCDNPRVAATLAVPGVHEIFRELGFQHLQEAASSSATPEPGMLNLPLRYPGPKEPLYHGVLSLLRPSISEAAAPTPSAPVDTPMRDVDAAHTPQSPNNGNAAPAPEPKAEEQPPAIDWGASNTKEATQEDPSSAASVAKPAAQEEGLGMSAAAWKAENKHNPKKALVVGGVEIPANHPQQPPQGPKATTLGAENATAAAPPKPDAEDEFTGRNTKVLLPTAPDAHIPDSFFERTGRDLKAEWQRVKKQRETDETLMTKAYREKLRMAGRKVHKYATIRVRFPEGIILQGCFLPSALAFEVHAWVTEHLRSLEPFELASPVLSSKDRKLGNGGTVKEAGLMPTCTLNFRWTPGGEPVHGPCLSDEALKLAQMDV